jgi:hypothetical protein
MSAKLYESLNRAKKVQALCAALPVVAEQIGMKPLDLLGIFTEDSWKLLAQLAGTTLPSEESRKEVRAHFETSAALQAQLAGKLQLARKSHKFNVENL